MRKSIVSLRLLILGILASVVVLSSQAQTKVRIAGPLDTSQRTTLKGNVSSLARAEFDQGAAPSSQQLTHVRMLLKRTSQQEAALSQFLSDVQNKGSVSYHKWLTPADYARLYGPAEQDIESLKSWLQSQGLTVEQVTAGNMVIEFSGSVAQIENAFQTSIHTFRVDGKDYYSNTTDPKIPQAATAVVAGIAHLNSFVPRSQAVLGRPGHFNPLSGALEPVSDEPASKVRPNLSYQDANGNNSLYVVPGDAATIYNTPNQTLNANYSASKAYTGTGVTIGIAADSNIDSTYVTAYRSLFLGNSTAPTITVVGSDPGINSDAVEAYLDAELSGGLAPDATVRVYVSSDLFSGIQQAIVDNKVDVLSVSFGACERYWTNSDNSFVYQLWMQAAAQGISVTVSTGDSGAAGCDNPNKVSSASAGFGVNAIASTPFNIAVGGTDYDTLATNFATYATVPSKPSSGAGSSSTFYRTAKSYIPENPWNDSTQSNTTYSNNTPFSGSNANIFGGSGGKSDCSTNTTTVNSDGSINPGSCTSGWPKPSWQKGSGVPSDGARDLPDVSLLAADGAYGAQWLICSPITTSTGTVQGCVKDSSGSWSFSGVGGTSAAAPAFAGMLALVVQSTGSRLGQAAPILYSLFNGPNASSVFNDVTTGNISVSCGAGTKDCSQNSKGAYFLPGYNAGTGYDLATGLGSVNVTNMIQYWSTAVPNVPTVTISPASTTINSINSLPVTVTVTSGSGTPTGTIELSNYFGGYLSGKLTLSNGTASTTIPPGSLITGSANLVASYSGDSTFAPAFGSATITVNGLTPTITVTPAATTVSKANSLSVTVSVAGVGSNPTPTGSVALSSGTYSGSAVALSNGTATITIPANSLTVGTATITATYSGDTYYAAGTSTASVTVAAPSISLSGSAVSVNAGSSGTSTITLTSANSYSGTVSLKCSVTSAPTGASSSYYPSCSFNPSSVTFTSSTTSATSTMTLSTTARTTAQNEVPPVAPWQRSGGVVALASLFLLGIPACRRNWRTMLGMWVVLFAFGGMIGCGGGGGGSKTTTGTTAGSYVVTVTATDSTNNVSSTTTVSVTVN